MWDAKEGDIDRDREKVRERGGKVKFLGIEKR